MKKAKLKTDLENLKAGEEVEILSCRNGWAKVKIKGTHRRFDIIKTTNLIF